MDGYDTLIVMFQGSVGSLHLMNYSMNENKKPQKSEYKNCFNIIHGYFINLTNEMRMVTLP